jgi:hypothetical protein
MRCTNSSRRRHDAACCLFAWGDRLGAGEVTDSSCPGSAGEADACGRPQPSRPPGSSYASLLRAVMWRGYNGRSRE